MSEAVILCEGYYDRSFWAGWLERLGCPSPGGKPVFDTQRKRVAGGEFGYWSPRQDFIRIVPCGGKDKVVPEAKRRLRGRNLEPLLSRLVVSIDPDVSVEGEDRKTGLRRQDVERIVREISPEAKANAESDIELDDGATRVSLVRWEADDQASTGVPGQQCLERLVCAAVVAAYSERGPAVQAWLDGRPAPPNSSPKDFAWSHMAGWYADRGCDNFYRAVWENESIVAHLTKYLEASGAWRIGKALVA